MKHRFLSALLFSAILAGCSPAPIPKNELPLYGGQRFTEKEKRSNERFIADISRFGREIAIEQMIVSAWEEFLKGDYNVAMRRFNQLWLLDPENAHVYYGIGCILYRKGLERDCLSWIEKAALRGLPSAQNLCGIFYDFGIGIEKNRDRARVWYEKADEAGYKGLWREARSKNVKVDLAVRIGEHDKKKGVGAYFTPELIQERINDEKLPRFAIRRLEFGQVNIFLGGAGNAVAFMETVLAQPEERKQHGLWLLVTHPSRLDAEDRRQLEALAKTADGDPITLYTASSENLPDGWTKGYNV